MTGNIPTYSANALGNTITWNNQTFDLGPATVSVPDAVSASGNPPIYLPQGQYTSVQFLAASVGGGPAAGTFYVDYTNGTGDSFTVGVSSWGQGYIGQTTAGAWESIAASMTSYNTSTGNTGGNVYVYGFDLPVNPTKTVMDLRTPNNGVIEILAVDVVDQPEQVNLGDATNSASPAFNAIGISVNLRTQVAGGGNTYSANLLGNTVSWNNQTFNIGPATVNVDDEVEASGWPPIALPEGQYTSIQLLASSVGGPQTQVFYVDYTNGTTDFFTLAVSDWTAGYDGGGTTAAWESIAASMGSYNTASGSQGTETYLYGYVLPTKPGLTVMDLRAPNDNNIKILAIDVVDQPTQVNLGSAINNANPPDNVTAVTTNYEATQGGTGIDGSGDTYSANALGGSSVTWNTQTFFVGPSSMADAVGGAGQTVALTPGYYTSLQFLGTATGGTPQTATFTINYVSGAAQNFTQSFSDWMYGHAGAGTTAPGEAIAATMTSYNTSTGTHTGTDVYLYGYVIPVDPTRMVSSIVFPNNAKVKILAIDEVNLPPQVNLGNASNANPPANAVGLTFTAGASNNGGTGLDGQGHTISLNALASVTGSASVISWNSEDFNLGPASVDDVIAGQSPGQTVVLPQGYFTSLQLLGLAVNGAQDGLQFTINYVSGSPTVITQSISDWTVGYNGTPGSTAPGESIVVHMVTYNNPSNPDGPIAGNAYIYGYTFTTDPTRMVSSIQFPSNTNIRILAIDEINAAQQADPEDGVIEGPAAVVVGAPPQTRGRLGSVPPLPTLLAQPSLGSMPAFGEDVVSTALDKMETSTSRPSLATAPAAASGPRWAAQSGSESGASSVAGSAFSAPGGLLSYRKASSPRIA